ncbi:MAG: hypothetical protein LH606_18920 [Cytophagaceae bacterium]|nr:hypothetical protein [Cytophagaceae bacterium]
MNTTYVLVIGDFHTYRVPDQQRFTEQFARRLRQSGQRVILNCYTPSTLCTVPSLLAQIPLCQYDLIVLQVGHDALQNARKTISQPSNSQQEGDERLNLTFPRIKNFLKQLTSGTLARLSQLVRLGTVRQHLKVILNGLQPYRQNVVILTHFPHREPLSHWLRKRGCRLFVRAGRRWTMQIVDVHELIECREEYFLSGDNAYLNASSHELIGVHLYDIYHQRTAVAWGHSMPDNSL